MLLSHLAAQVFSIERVPALYQKAREILRQLDVRNVSMLLGDGSIGWREYAPYDAILVSAGAPDVPAPLVDQLAEGGTLLIPLGNKDEQVLVSFERKDGAIVRRDIAPVRFVPLLGTHGWQG
jgi:protein-L-isoaspartate(D-aspartate) O-methyltransferase